MIMIILGADIVPTSSNELLFEHGDTSAIVDKSLLDLLGTADYRIFNLETPLTDQDTPISKCGPNLKASTKAVAGLKKLGIDLFTLANNHILDQGEQGLHSTENVLRENKIAYIGVGETPDEAAKPYIFTVKGKRIGIYACAEHEFSIVTSHSAGANPFDPLESPDHVASLKQQCDYVIVLYHGGKEHYRYPSPYLRKTCRKLVEKGADLVVCQHSHCIGCEEKYMSGTIVYGQGNFLFDHSDSEFWQTSLLICVNDNLSVSYIPLRKNGNGVRMAEGEDADRIMSDYENRSKEIEKDGFIEEKFAELAENVTENYLAVLAGVSDSFMYKLVGKLTGHRLNKRMLERRYSGKQLLAVKNHIECEAHQSIYSYIFKSR